MKDFFLLKLIYIFSLYSYSCTTFYKNSNFRYHENCSKFRAKTLTFYSCAKLRKNDDLNYIYSFLILCNFFLSNKCTILCKTGFVLIQNWCEISCKISLCEQKHETVAHENLLFRGNPNSVSLKIWLQR